MATKPKPSVAERMAAAAKNVRVSKKPATKSTPAVSAKTKLTKLDPKKKAVGIKTTLTLKRGGSLK